MKIGIASDHRGIIKKAKLEKYLKKQGYNVNNYGTNTKESVDYPDYAYIMGKKINEKEVDIGILICGSGIGMSMAANKIPNIRCAKVNNIKEAKLAKLHNNANIIALASNTNIIRMKDIIDEFLNTTFSQEDRHIRRVNKVNNHDLIH